MFTFQHPRVDDHRGKFSSLGTLILILSVLLIFPFPLFSFVSLYNPRPLVEGFFGGCIIKLFFHIACKEVKSTKRSGTSRNGWHDSRSQDDDEGKK